MRSVPEDRSCHETAREYQEVGCDEEKKGGTAESRRLFHSEIIYYINE
jgi:hypothetical protein